MKKPIPAAIGRRLDRLSSWLSALFEGRHPWELRVDRDHDKHVELIGPRFDEGAEDGPRFVEYLNGNDIAEDLNALATTAGVVRDLERRVTQLETGIRSAMGCLEPLGDRVDERLAWHRLNGALAGESPKPSLAHYVPESKVATSATRLVEELRGTDQETAKATWMVEEVTRAGVGCANPLSDLIERSRSLRRQAADRIERLEREVKAAEAKAHEHWRLGEYERHDANYWNIEYGAIRRDAINVLERVAIWHEAQAATLTGIDIVTVAKAAVHKESAAAIRDMPKPAPRDRASVVGEIARERYRQIEDEGFGAAHDELHSKGALALAAALYATPVQLFTIEISTAIENTHTDKHGRKHWRPSDGAMTWADPWPWTDGSDKRAKHDRRRQLVIAGALIAAEIDRLDRIAAAKAGEAKHE